MTDAPEDRDEELPDGQLQLDNLTTASNDDHAGRVVVAYARDDDRGNIATTLQQLLTHSQDELGYEHAGNDAATIAQHPVEYPDASRARGIEPGDGYDGGVIIYDTDESHPEGVEHLLDVVAEHDVDDVTALTLAAVGAVDEATRVVERLQDEEVTTHLIEDDLVIEPGDERARELLAAARRASRVDTDASNQLVTEATGTKWEGGQPPQGFTVNARGYLQRDEETWETIRRAAKAVEEDELSEYRASQLTGHSRHAIRTALNEYRDAYRVEEADPLTINDDAEQ